MPVMIACTSGVVAVTVGVALLGRGEYSAALISIVLGAVACLSTIKPRRSQ